MFGNCENFPKLLKLLRVGAIAVGTIATNPGIFFPTWGVKRELL